MQAALDPKDTAEVLRISGNDPRRLVELVDINTLLRAYADDSPFALLDFPNGVVFVCPRCGHLDANGGTAQMLGEWRWKCFRTWRGADRYERCGGHGTRMMLERIILEDDQRLDRLFAAVHERIRGQR